MQILALSNKIFFNFDKLPTIFRNNLVVRPFHEKRDLPESSTYYLYLLTTE